MSETIAALIAFVGFLILFSMIVQSAQEAVKNILKLRVGVWERFFINLYSDETKFNIGKITYLSRLKMYIKRIWSSSFNGEFDKGFARLKEMLTIADNTFKALKKSLRNIVELKPDAPDTPRLILYQLQPVLEAIGQAKGLALSKFLYIYDVFKKEELKKLYDEIIKFEVQHARIEHLLRSSTKELVADFQTACKNLLRAIESVEDQAIESVEDRLSRYRIQAEQNIDSWISQINEEYRRNMLKWTVVIGFVFVIIANADSFSIYKYLRSDTKVQAAIAEKVKDIRVMKQTSDPGELNKILAALKENKLQEVKKLSGTFLAKLEDDYRAVGARGEAVKVKQLKESVEKIDITAQEESRKLWEEYDKIVDFNVRLPQVSIEKQMRGLAELELPLGWTSDKKKYNELKAEIKAKKKASDASEEYIRFVLKKIGGLLLTTVLITFGAPFWNDILGALTGIRNLAQRK